MADDFVSVHLVFDGVTIPVEYNMPFTLKQIRGTDPYMVSLMFSDISQFPDPSAFQEGAQCKFQFSTPAPAGGRVNTEWDGWYLIRLEPSKSEEGMWIAHFADERWAWQYRRYDLSMNMLWSDGSYRLDTTPNGGNSPWQVIPAIKRAGEIMGLEVVVDGLPVFTPPAILPNNLGNSPGGGWVQEQPGEIFKPMLDCLDADLILDPHKRKRVIVVPRTGDPKGTIAKVRAMPRLVDTLGTVSNGYEKPRKVRVSFEVKAEAVMESRLLATSTAIPVFDVPENVVPRFTPALLDPQAWLDEEVSQKVNKSEWQEYRDWLKEAGYAATNSDASDLVARNWFLPNIIPLKRGNEHEEIREDPSSPTANSLAYQKKLWYDEQLRHCWRRVMRIKYPTNLVFAGDLVKDMRSMIGLRFGRLTAGGDTIARGAFYGDWAEETVHATQLDPTDPLKSTFSTNHPFDVTRPAPFTCRWVAEVGNELIFEIRPAETTRISQSKLFPGLLRTALTYGDWYKLSNDGYMDATELSCDGFTDPWKFRIYFSGRLIGPDLRDKTDGATPIGAFEGRRLVVEQELYPKGSMPEMDLKYDGTTANYGYTKAQMTAALGDLSLRWPAQMLNKKEIEGLVADAVAKLKQQFELGKSGGLSVVGVQPLADKLYTGGDIHEMSVVIGDPDPWSIKTQFLVLPGIPAFTLSKEDREGKTVNFIEQE